MLNQQKNGDRIREPVHSGTPVQQGWLHPAALWLTTSLFLLLALSPAVSGLGVVFDLAANLSNFAAIPLSIIAISAMLSGRRRVAACAAFGVCAVAFWFLARADWPAATSDQSKEVSLIFSNIEGQPTAWPRLRSLVEQRQPDLIALVEAEPAVIDLITRDRVMTEMYPFRVMPRPGWNWAQVLLSRYPLTPLGLISDDPRYKFLFSFHRTTVVSHPQGEFILTAEHPPSPRSPTAWERGNEQIKLLCEIYRDFIDTRGLPFVVAGDFNTAPTGYRVRLLSQLAGLHGDPSAGFTAGSWPSLSPAPFRIPLDRVWANQYVAFTAREVLVDIGSDHRPVLIRFSLRSAREAGGAPE